MEDQILETLPRETIWRAQTPQVFQKPALEEAIQIAIDENLEGTDEASILEKIGYQIGFVEGSPLNIKITILYVSFINNYNIVFFCMFYFFVNYICLL